MRMLTVGFLRDQFAAAIERVRACELRCYPHEWAILFERPPSPATATATATTASTAANPLWEYAGRFTARPSDAQLQTLLHGALTKSRNRAFTEAANDGSAPPGEC